MTVEIAIIELPIIPNKNIRPGAANQSVFQANTIISHIHCHYIAQVVSAFPIDSHTFPIAIVSSALSKESTIDKEKVSSLHHYYSFGWSNSINSLKLQYVVRETTMQ
jgi:hypothetical protein